jgi:pilus assembly protein TadC
METDEAPQPAPLTAESVYSALTAALGPAPEARAAAQASLQAYEKDAVPGFLSSLLAVVQQGAAVSEACPCL